MKHAAIMLLLSLCLAAPAHAASDLYTTDKPSPLQLLEPDREHVVAQFSGRVELAGRFAIAWESLGGRDYLRVDFLPDSGSAALLPRMVMDRPVEVLTFVNSEQAVAILLDPGTAQKILAKDLLHAKGEATVTISAYQVEVACDRRWYSAELLSASRNREIVVGARESVGHGCG